jgi:hypothetical protein
MNESDRKALPAYRAALIELVKRAHGELFVPRDNTIAHEGGTIMYRIEPDGIRFRFVPDGPPQ